MPLERSRALFDSIGNATQGALQDKEWHVVPGARPMSVAEMAAHCKWLTNLMEANSTKLPPAEPSRPPAGPVTTTTISPGSATPASSAHTPPSPTLRPSASPPPPAAQPASATAPPPAAPQALQASPLACMRRSARSSEASSQLAIPNSKPATKVATAPADHLKLAMRDIDAARVRSVVAREVGRAPAVNTPQAIEELMATTGIARAAAALAPDAAPHPTEGVTEGVTTGKGADGEADDDQHDDDDNVEEDDDLDERLGTSMPFMMAMVDAQMNHEMRARQDQMDGWEADQVE